MVHEEFLPTGLQYSIGTCQNSGVRDIQNLTYLKKCLKYKGKQRNIES